MTKAVTTALGRNPKVKTKGESMCNGFKSLLPTATLNYKHIFSGCVKQYQKKDRK
jgi:hypothetical protein